MKNTQFPWGAIQGSLPLTPALLDTARSLAQAHFAQAEAEEFCGDAVEDMLLPDELLPVMDLLPHQELLALGFEVRKDAQVQLLATASVDSHEDDIHGPVLIVALHNDGLKFKQGRQAHVTQAGQWFVFDDRKPHEVREGKKSTSYLALSVPLRLKHN